MHNEIDRLVAQALYKGMIKEAEQRALFGPPIRNKPPLQYTIARIVGNLLLAGGERLRRYSEAGISQSVLRV